MPGPFKFPKTIMPKPGSPKMPRQPFHIQKALQTGNLRVRGLPNPVPNITNIKQDVPQQQPDLQLHFEKLNKLMRNRYYNQ